MSPGPGRGVTYTRDHDTHPQYEARLSPACDISSAGGGVSPYVRCVRTDRCDHAHGDRREVAGGGPSASPAHAARTGHRLQEELLSGGQADAGTGSLYILSSGSGA